MGGEEVSSEGPTFNASSPNAATPKQLRPNTTSPVLFRVLLRGCSCIGVSLGLGLQKPNRKTRNLPNHQPETAWMNERCSILWHLLQVERKNHPGSLLKPVLATPKPHTCLEPL